MASFPCNHTALRSFAGMTVVRVVADSVVFHCDRCKAGVRVGRCRGTNANGLRCRKPARALRLTCKQHRGAETDRWTACTRPHARVGSGCSSSATVTRT